MAAAVALVILLVGVATSGALTLMRATAPTTGGQIGNAAAFDPDGVVVQRLPGSATALEDGDAVAGIDGRSLVDSTVLWPGDAVAGPVVGDTLRIDVRREGVPLAVDVVAEHYPLGAVLVASWGTLTFALAHLGIGLYVFGRRPRLPAAGALLIGGVGSAGSTVPFLLGFDPLDFVAGRFGPLMLGINALYVLLWAGLLDFALVFPRPLRPIARTPALRLVPYVGLFGLSAAGIVVAGLASPTTFAWLGTWGALSLLPVAVAFAAIPVVLVVRWRSAPLEDRRILRAFGVMLGFTIVAALVVWVVPEALGGTPLVPWTMAGLLGLPFPIVIAASILRHRAFDIDLVVRRSLVYGGMTLLVVAVYAVAAAMLASLGPSSTYATSLLATGIAALAALPIRDGLQRTVARLLYGDRDEPVRAIRRLGERLELSVDPDTMPRVVVDTVADALRLPYVALELGAPPASRLVAERGVRPAGTTERALTFQGQPIGRLRVGARGPADPLSDTDLRLLDDLCRQIGVAAHAALLTEDLRASRERLVTAREEERRRLRRDLHDGLGPALAAIGMRAGAAESVVTSDPEAAARLLAELQAEVSAAVGDIRRLVDALRPPAIDEVGLVGALRLAADRLQAPGSPQLVVESEGPLPELPAAVEVAAYRIGTEAMTNAVRHAAASRCSLRLVGGAELMVVVEDDGAGLPAEPRPGVGLASMHDRAAELGGECRIERRPGGGTRVVARLPLAPGPLLAAT